MTLRPKPAGPGEEAAAAHTVRPARGRHLLASATGSMGDVLALFLPLLRRSHVTVIPSRRNRLSVPACL